jgi:hypothetical protein
VKISVVLSATTLAMGCTFAAAAADKDGVELTPPSDIKRLKMGLWEETRQEEAAPRPAMDMSAMDMSSMTPEQRARVEAVLKRQAAERAAQGNNPTVTNKTKRSCLTAQKIDREWTKMPFQERGGSGGMSCTNKVLQSTSSKLAVRGECTIPDSGTKGEGPPGGGHFVSQFSMEVKSPELFVVESSTEGVVAKVPTKRHGTMTARWIGSDCGSVK